jgi:AAA+ superfamily predicted ATPase
MAGENDDEGTIDFFDQFLNAQDEEAQEPPRFGKKVGRRERPNAGDVLVALSLNKAVDADVRQRFQAGNLKAVVVSVPDPGWASPVADAIADSIEQHVHRIIREKIPLPRDLDDPRLPARLRDGEIVVGVAQEPDRALPPLLLSVAEARIAVPAPDAALVVETIRHCQEGDVPHEASELKPQLLSFDELCSLIPHGGNAAETIARIRLAIERKLSAGIGRKRKLIPRLEEAVEYGEARQWALRLRDDIIDLRDGLATWDDIDRGAVFHGPPGTGKTLLAQMLGEATGLPTVVSSIAELFASSSGYLDGVIKAMRKVFDEAKAKSPCILFWDELNALPRVDRLDSKNRDYWMPVILDFYTALDGAMSDRSGVIVIGATNRLEDIHPALLRSGRLERAIFVGPPDEHGVERIMRHHLAGELADADLTMLARLDVARSATGAVIEEQIRAARRLARRARRPMILDDVEAQIVTAEDRTEAAIRRAAVHEAGHALAGIVNGEVLKMVSIIQVGSFGGGTVYDRDHSLSTRSDFESTVVRILAARAAEEVILGEPSQGAGGADDSDIGHATQIAAMIEGAFGLGSSLVYRAAPDDVGALLMDPLFRAKVDAALTALYDRALELVRKHESEILVIADALVERKFMTGDEVRAILDRHRGSAAAAPIAAE